MIAQRSSARCRLRGAMLAVAAASFAASCASMGPATPRLSVEVADRMAEMQALHLRTVQQLFALERQRIEDFLERRWVPLFLKNFMGESAILDDLRRTTQLDQEQRSQLEALIGGYLLDPVEAAAATEQVVDALDARRADEDHAVRAALADFVEDDRLDAATGHVMAYLRAADPAERIIEWTEAAQREIHAQRRELLEPLDQQERELVTELQRAYGEIIAAQGTITGRLEAAARVKLQQDALLASVGAKDVYDEARRKLAGVSDKVSSAIREGEMLLDEERLGDLAGTFRDVLGGESRGGGD